MGLGMDEHPSKHNPVTNPAHYVSDPSGVECIEITRWRSYNIGNAFKYLWRAGLKDEATQIEDLNKAIFYIQDEIVRLKEIQAKNPVPSIHLVE